MKTSPMVATLAGLLAAVSIACAGQMHLVDMSGAPAMSGMSGPATPADSGAATDMSGTDDSSSGMSGTSGDSSMSGMSGADDNSSMSGASSSSSGSASPDTATGDDDY